MLHCEEDMTVGLEQPMGNAAGDVVVRIQYFTTYDRDKSNVLKYHPLCRVDFDVFISLNILSTLASCLRGNARNVLGFPTHFVLSFFSN